MKQKINENIDNVVKINIMELANDYSPDFDGKIDMIAEDIEDENPGTVVTLEDYNGQVLMVISGLTPSEVINIFAEKYFIDDVDTYFVDTTEELTEGYGDAGDWEDIPDYEEDDDEIDDEIDDIITNDDYDIDQVDIPDYDDVNIDNMEDDDYDEEDAYDNGDMYYESEDDDYDDDDILNDCDDSFDECVESIDDEEFECYESKKTNKKKSLLEKRKSKCCPTVKKVNKMVNLYEALNIKKHNKLTVKDIVKAVKNKVSLNESIINNAINKAKQEEDKPINKKVTNELLCKLVGAEKFNLIKKALKEKRKCLYTKKSINGKNMSEYSAKELHEMLKTISEKYNKLVKSYKSLNESATKSTKKELMDEIQKKERLMDILDEELTYRVTFKNILKKKGIVLNEEEEVKDDASDAADNTSDIENTNAADENTDDNETDENEDNPDENEEVELSRVVITVANQEAADELKSAMTNAGIPEDAIEFESEEDDESDDTEDDESDNNTAEESNESLHLNKFKHLLEDEDTESEDNNEDDESNNDNEESDDDTKNSDDNTEEKEDVPVKVVLTNTDYVNDLADVLNNEYGITKEEFEEMIGGEIVDDSEDDSDEDSNEENTEEKEDEPSTNGDDAVDAMSQEEIDKLFAGA